MNMSGFFVGNLDSENRDYFLSNLEYINNSTHKESDVRR